MPTHTLTKFTFVFPLYGERLLHVTRNFEISILDLLWRLSRCCKIVHNATITVYTKLLQWPLISSMAMLAGRCSLRGFMTTGALRFPQAEVRLQRGTQLNIKMTRSFLLARHTHSYRPCTALCGDWVRTRAMVFLDLYCKLGTVQRNEQSRTVYALLLETKKDCEGSLSLLITPCRCDTPDIFSNAHANKTNKNNMREIPDSPPPSMVWFSLGQLSPQFFV